MNSKLLLLICFFISLIATSCTARAVTNNPDAYTVVDAVTLQSRKDQRAQDVKFLAHVTNRTVFLTSDCTPKSGLIVLSAKKPSKVGDGWGSGTVVRSTKNVSYIFTAAHVVEFRQTRFAKHFDCKYFAQRKADVGTDNNKMEATIVSKDSDKDVAVLSVNANLGVNTHLASKRILGEDVWAAGFPAQKIRPGSKRMSITRGTLATLGVPPYMNARKYGYFDRVTSQVYSGSSGGGIWNIEGQLVAVVNQMSTAPVEGKVPYEGYYYVKPIKEIIMMLSRDDKYKEVFSK